MEALPDILNCAGIVYRQVGLLGVCVCIVVRPPAPLSMIDFSVIIIDI